MAILMMTRTRVVAVAGAILIFLDAYGLQAAEGRRLKGHVPASVPNLSPVGRLPASKRLDLAIGLPLRNRGVLTNLLQDLYDPASPRYHQYLTPDEFSREF